MKEDFLTYNVKDEDEGLKIDNILKYKMNLSRRMIIGLKKNKNIFLNGKEAFTNEKVYVKDEVSVNLAKDESQDIEPQNIPIDIVFEDKDILVVNKQPGIVVHPTKGHPTDTLANGIIYHFRSMGEDTIVRLVNRLDRDTSGLIIVAKNQFCHQAMAKQFEANQVEKLYYAVAHGEFDKDEDTVSLPIDRPTKESIKREVMNNGQMAITHYNIIEKLKGGALLRIKLETGKTHQIRVHLSHIGHPLYGDTLYGENDDSDFIKRQALHAYMLKFRHPRNGEDIVINTPIPADIMELIEKIKK